MAESLSVERMRRWGLNGVLAILDQGIFSGSNFLLNVLLARWLMPQEYGAYAVAFTVSVLFLQLLVSYILEPMSVLGPSSYRLELQSYLIAQVRVYFIVMIPAGLLLATAAYLYDRLAHDILIGRALIAMGLLLSFVLLPWIFRRIFYILGQPNLAVGLSSIYALSLTLVVILLREQNLLSGVTSVFTVALAGLLSGSLLFFKLRAHQLSVASFSPGSIHRGNWKFGRWLIFSSVLMVIAAQSQIYIAGGVLGLEASGAIYALQTLSNPMTLTVTAVMALMTPSLASDYAEGKATSFKRKTFFMSLALTGLAVLFELFLIVFRKPIEQLVYGSAFSSHVNLIPIWGLSPLITSLVSGMQTALQAAKYPQSILIASLFWLPVSVGSSVLFIQGWGLWGLAWSTVLGYLAFGSVLTFLYWYRLSRTPKPVVQM